MIGLIGLAIAGLYIGFWVWVLSITKNRNAKALAIIFALAIPFWDLPIGYYNFNVHCGTDGGIREIEKVPPQKTLYFELGTGPTPEYLIRSGLEQAEYSQPSGNGVVRFTKNDRGEIQSVKAPQPVSVIHVKASFSEQLGWNVVRQEMALVESRTSRTLAQARAYAWQGGWIQRQTAPLLTSYVTCHRSSFDQLVNLAINGGGK